MSAELTDTPSHASVREAQLDRLSECTDAPGAPERFTDFARRLFTVPKEEYDAELKAVENGKPLKRDFGKSKKSVKSPN